MQKMDRTSKQSKMSNRKATVSTTQTEMMRQRDEDVQVVTNKAIQHGCVLKKYDAGSFGENVCEVSSNVIH